jgi:hypothetical protein
MDAAPIAETLELLETQTGVVISVYLPPRADPEASFSMLRDTVLLYIRELRSPYAICLSVDGPGPGETIARRLADSYGVCVVVAPQNRGKLAAVATGMAALLDNPTLRYLAAIDQDGDHFANELLNFVRCAEHVADQTGNRRGMVLGNRVSRHRPLGFLRAEHEELANRILLDALTYDAARCGTPLGLQYLTTLDPLPDFHSGYKLFSRETAAAVFTTPPQLAGCSEDAYYRHAVEAVTTVEAHKAGAWLAAVNRRTYDEQPVSVFASLNRALLAADMILWPCKRLGIPAHFVDQWLTNHLPTLLLGTLVPQGRDELLAIAALVRDAYGLPKGSTPAEIARPRFV